MERYDVFISYKRSGVKESSHLALRLYDYLTAKGYKVFWDRKTLGRGGYDEQISDAIENAKDVLILLEEGSLLSCQGVELFRNDSFCKEITFALEKNKKAILPIFLNGFNMQDQLKLSAVIQELYGLQGIKFNTKDSIKTLYDSKLSGESRMRLNSIPSMSSREKILMAFVVVLSIIFWTV